MRLEVAGYQKCFLHLCSACAAFLDGRRLVLHETFRRKRPAPRHSSAEGRSFNTVRASTYDYAESRMTKDGTIPLPDPRQAGGAEFVGGAFYEYDPKYSRNTILRDFPSPTCAKFNVMAEVAPNAKRQSFDLHFESFNLLNHTNFNPPATSTSSDLRTASERGRAAILPFAAKFVF